TVLARTYSEASRIRDAALRFNEAIEIVENDDHYLQSEKLRVKFDDTRRDLFDSVIEFEYNKRTAPDAAWNHLQKYRSKLFIEFLAQFDPNVERVHAEALDRSHVQKLIPADAQVVEYALLRDRLLIWVISKEVFTVRSVQVAREDVESKVRKVLQGLRNRDDVDSLLIDLGKLLVEPVADLLDRNRTLVVVPDRALHGLPFGVLRRPGSREYLLQEFPILISPNLTHLLLTKAVEPRRDRIGVRGLTSAFLLGGAGSVVGSLWPVEASSTADLMIRFHRAFANSQMPIAKALQQAQLTFLESFPERSHPYYWSGFVVTGN